MDQRNPDQATSASSAVPRTAYHTLRSADLSSIAPRLLESPGSHFSTVASPLLEPPAQLSLNPSPASTPHLPQSQRSAQPHRHTPQLAHPTPSYQTQHRQLQLHQSPLPQGSKRKRSEAADDEDDESTTAMPETKQQRFIRPEQLYSPEFAQPFNFATPVSMSQTYFPPPSIKSSTWKGPSSSSQQQQSNYRRVSAPATDSGPQRAGRQSSTVSSMASVSPHASNRFSEPPNAYGQAAGSYSYSTPGVYNYGAMSPFATDQYGSGVVQSPMTSMPEPGFASSSSYYQPRTLPNSFPPLSSGTGLGLQRMPQTPQETPRSKPRCWEHGCNGREFSTFSNLLRHQREKSGTAVKSYCPRCGAEFTRSTAMSNHLQQAKCKARTGSE